MTEHARISIRHAPDAQRFYADVEGGRGVMAYERVGDRIIFTHTSVPPEAEGQGVGSALAREALRYARAERLHVVAQCPFMVAYLERHPEHPTSE